MKKMVMLFAAIAMAIGAQAVTVRWDVFDSDAKGIYWVKGSGGPDDDEARRILGTLIPSLTTTLDYGGAWTWSDQLAASQASDLKQFTNVGEGLFAYSDASFFDEYFAILATYDDANLTPGGSFNVYIAENTEHENSFYLSEMTPVYSGNFGGEAIPEPTSGLLLLLGMAGLALKRKVA